MLFLRQQTHADGRDDEQVQDAHVLHQPAQRRFAATGQDQREQVARQGQKERDDHVRQRRQEVAAQLALGDRPHVSHDSSSAVSLVVNCRKISSRLRWAGLSSIKPKPPLTTALARASRMSAPTALWTVKLPRPLAGAMPSASASTLVTCGTPLRTLVTWSRGPRTVNAMLSAPLRRRSRFSGVSSATTRPLEMMTIREQVAATSGRMWVLKMTVCSPPNDLIRWRTSMICFGSRPLVGSSRMSTGGSPSSAWASPTRWRRPFDNLPIWSPARLAMRAFSMARSTSRRRSLTALILPMKSRYERTLMSE